MASMLPWPAIHTVLLDLDGTLLDLHFDNYFWQIFVPERYAQHKGMSNDQATKVLMDKYQAVEGTIDWYSVDYWSQELGLDIAELKSEIRHLIRIHPTVIEFLSALNKHDKNVILVTNAHQHSLAIKLEHTELHEHFDSIVCAHDFGLPKEDHTFWDHLVQQHPFDREHTLLIDDSLPVLRSAKQFGIKYLLAVSQPDSQKPIKPSEEFDAISDFKQIDPAT